MQILGRPLARVVRAPFGRQHWLAASRMPRVYAKPVDAARRYLFASGSYPHDFDLQTSAGKVRVTAWSHHDLLTINEIFCRQDYPVSPTDRVVVDFGSNIGISALYFLTHAPRSIIYCFEPLPINCRRLRSALTSYADRYCLHEKAVAPVAGAACFGYEATGRHGGIDIPFEDQTKVECVSASETIAAILMAHSKIDLLKIDIEGLEQSVLQSLPTVQVARIEKIYAETSFVTNPLAETHTMRQYGSVAQFARRPG